MWNTYDCYLERDFVHVPIHDISQDYAFFYGFVFAKTPEFDPEKGIPIGKM